MANQQCVTVEQSMDQSMPDGKLVGDISIARAIEVFVHGFSFTRSMTHPYLVEQIGSLWVLRDAPRRRGTSRNEEWVAYGMVPDEIDRLVREQAGGRFFLTVICDLHEGHEPLRSRIKALGYRLGRTEPLMIHKLRRIPHADSPAMVERVTTVDLAAHLAQATRTRPMQPEHYGPDSAMWQYMSLVNDEVVGWCSSILVGDATWCANMYVLPQFRRRGIARAMLCRMLHDDRARGANTAVLSASHAGAKLYPVVGYEQIGSLLLFSPKRI